MGVEVGPVPSYELAMSHLPSPDQVLYFQGSLRVNFKEHLMLIEFGTLTESFVTFID